jgi:hypothetical protein
MPLPAKLVLPLWCEVWSKTYGEWACLVVVARDTRSQCARPFPPIPVGSPYKFQLTPFIASVVTESAVNISWYVCWKSELWSEQRQPLLGNCSTNTPVARQQLLEHAIIAELSLSNVPMQQWRNCLKRCFLWGLFRGHITRTSCRQQ